MCAIVHSDSGKSVSSKPVLKRGDKNMGKYFGTAGFRGEANVTLTVEDAFMYAGSSSEKTREEAATCSSIPWWRD